MTQQEAEEKSEHFLIVAQSALVIRRLTSNTLTFENGMKYEQKQCFKRGGN
ncbi:MAG: hypothetical protein NTY50_14285 [Methylobacter sp.]|nr:hypothetical protein [Methylobacter sp.]